MTSLTIAQISQLTDKDMILTEWKSAVDALTRAKSRELALRKKVQTAFSEHASDSAWKGTENVPLPHGFTLKFKYGLRYKLDPDATDDAIDAMEKAGNEGAFIADRLVKWKPELSVSEYNKLSEYDGHAKYKTMIDTALTVTPATVTVELVPPKA